MLKIVEYVGNSPDGKNVCSANKLFVEGWSFQEWLAIEDIKSIFIAMAANIPCGCIIMLNKQSGSSWYPNFGIYVKPEYRLKGIGSRLMKRMIKKYPDHILVNGNGIIGSSTFFSKTMSSTIEND